MNNCIKCGVSIDGPIGAFGEQAKVGCPRCLEDPLVKKLQEINELVIRGCLESGLNTAHGYEGVETYEDLIVYLKALIREATPRYASRRKWANGIGTDMS